MIVIREPEEWNSHLRDVRARGLSTGFVPTMGYLHDGHLSLIRRSVLENAFTSVSVFVNPLQFNNPDDLARYPSDEQRDLEILQSAGVDAVFLPSVQQMYPDGPVELKMWYPQMDQLCGAFRPGHFSGVLIIVHNLLLLTGCNTAYFGEKDYQQLLLIRKMVRDLQLPVTIRSGKTIREDDGLAMSSRNVRLSVRGRQEAVKIPETLQAAIALPLPEAVERLGGLARAFTTDYAGVFHPDTLLPVQPDSGGPFLLAVALYVDGVRLIDNVLVDELPSPGFRFI